MLKFGRVSDISPDRGVARVFLEGDDIVTNWLPVSVMRSSGDTIKVGFPLGINEHVWCIMDENCEYGVIGGAIYSAKSSPPHGSDQQLIISLANTSQIAFDIKTGTLKIACVGDITVTGQRIMLNSKTEIELKAVSKVAITAPQVLITDELNVGTVNARQDIKADAVSLKLHTHTSSSPGNPTSPPA